MKARNRRSARAVWISAVGLAVVATTVTGGAVVPGGGVRAAAAAMSTLPWLAPGLTVDQRVDLLLENMTLTEKIAELHADACPPYQSCIPANLALGLPELVLEDDSTGVAAGMQGVTALPATIAASASFDPSLTQAYGAVIGGEEKAKGVNVALAPTVNIARNPQWGRNFESLGEDPYLSSQMAAADVQGIQSQGVISDVKHFAVYNQEANRKTVNAVVDPRTMQEIYLPAFNAAVNQGGAGAVMSAYNAVNGVLDSQNPELLSTILRDQMGFQGFVRSDGGGTYSTVPAANAGLDLQVKGVDYFGAPLAAAVAAGTVSEAQLNSMLTPILRAMFQFNLVGVTWGTGSLTSNVITPQDTQTALDTAEQGAVLLRNQNNALPLSASTLNSIAVVGPDASPGMPEGGGSGYVTTPFDVSPVQGIQAAAPNAQVSYAAGLPTPSSLPAIPSTNLSPAYASSKSGYTGTLTPTVSGDYILAVSDPTAYSTMTMSVNGTEVLTSAGTPGFQFGSAMVTLQAGQAYQISITGPSNGFFWALPSVNQAAIAQAVATASSAQVAVVVVGDTESEAMDRVGLGLDPGDDALVEAVAAANPNTIVVLNSGSAVLMPWIDQVSAVLEAWYPGEQDGTALAALLFGQVDPSGKLPVTFPASAGQIPASTPQQFPGVNGVADYSEGLDVGYRWYDQNNQTPLFPFGYGLSYTSFAFSDLTICPGVLRSTDNVQVGVTVTNTGDQTGAETAQLYLGDPSSIGEPPRQLKGFQKVTLAPGQSTRVTFTLTPSDLAYWDTTQNNWDVADGTYRVYVGDSSALTDLPLTGDFLVRASTGGRAVTVQAPAQATAGQPVTVSATFSAGGDLPLLNTGMTLSAPDGWTISPVGQTSQHVLLPAASLTVSWQVTPPADVPANVDMLTATASYSMPGPPGPQAIEVGRAQTSVQSPLG